MDATTLAKLMIDYQEKAEELQELGDMITREVLALGKSQQVGNLRATYYGPRKTYEYPAVLREPGATAEIIAEYSEITVKTDWKKVCEAIDFDPPYTEAEPRVVLKLEKKEA